MYTIDDKKMKAVVKQYNRVMRTRVTRRALWETINSDWHEGEEHQTWLDEANAYEIADWLTHVHTA